MHLKVGWQIIVSVALTLAFVLSFMRGDTLPPMADEVGHVAQGN